MEDGMRLTAGAEFAGLSAPPDFRHIRRMIKHAQTSLPGLSPRPLSEWLGFRPSMPKSMPVIGPLPRYPQVILAFGHGHLGLTLGPVTGGLVAATLAGRKPRIDLTPFLPMHSVR
jgi:D-amino-acid dehydrogenase